jgi:hypothetical protein
LTEKFQRPGEVSRQLPVTFDAAVARGRDDVVLAHLNYPLAHARPFLDSDGRELVRHVQREVGITGHEILVVV